MTTPSASRADCAALDAADPLASWRDEFSLPEGLVYLDGNSLGVLPKRTPARVAALVDDEWGNGLIRSWNTAGWINKPQELGDRIAPLIGAADGTVVVADSTSLNVFKLIVSAVRLRPDRRVVVSDRGNFPTDLYMTAGALELAGGYEQRWVGEGAATLDDVLDESVAAVLLTQVDYSTGRMYDMASVTERVHGHGALMIWDLCHSVGAVPVDLAGVDADFAVGCTYKYLNGGPGSPAFVYAAPRLQDQVRQPLSGWMGHASPFDFETTYRPAVGVSRFMVGTPSMLSYAALEASLDLWAKVEMKLVREKSLALTDLFIALVESRCSAYGVSLATPREHTLRGSQVSFRHPSGYAVMQALIDRDVIGDFRSPDVMRFGFTPLYLRYVDVWDAVDVLEVVLRSEAWRDERYAQRLAVT
jgi:kynureninase